MSEQLHPKISQGEMHANLAYDAHASEWDELIKEREFEFQSVNQQKIYDENRPYQDSNGAVHSPIDGNFINSDEYFDKQRTTHEENLQTPYEEMGMLELARELAKAELAEDRTSTENISDVLIDKLAYQADVFHGKVEGSGQSGAVKDGEVVDPADALWSRVMGYKDSYKDTISGITGAEVLPEQSVEETASEEPVAPTPELSDEKSEAPEVTVDPTDSEVEPTDEFETIDVRTADESLKTYQQLPWHKRVKYWFGKKNRALNEKGIYYLSGAWKMEDAEDMKKERRRVVIGAGVLAVGAAYAAYKGLPDFNSIDGSTTTQAQDINSLDISGIGDVDVDLPAPEAPSAEHQAIDQVLHIDAGQGFENSLQDQYGLSDQQARGAYEAMREHLAGDPQTYMQGSDIRITNPGNFSLNDPAQHALEDYLRSIGKL